MKTRTLILTTLLLIICAKNYAQQSSTEKVEEEQNPHWEPTHNFTVKRLLIFNDRNEVLMEKVESNWYPPSLVFYKRQHIKESLDSLSNTYGIKTKGLQLRAYLSFKYEYHPYATLRPYYTVNYISGDIVIPEDREDVKWMPIKDAVKKTPVESMKMIIEKITTSPDVVWGGTFMVYRKGEEHHARLEEPLFPLFKGN